LESSRWVPMTTSTVPSPKEQKAVVAGLREGTVDVVIGTHRLLSKDVAFKRLGLLIVDEEHRFGVAHKERMKQLRTSVDVLALTATPIPRTLYMSLSGVRDMSVIETPPIDRLPVEMDVEQDRPRAGCAGEPREHERTVRGIREQLRAESATLERSPAQLTRDIEQTTRGWMERLGMARRDRERLAHMLRAQPRLMRPRGRRFRPRAFVTKHYYPDAEALFALGCRATGLELETLERWRALYQEMGGAAEQDGRELWEVESETETDETPPPRRRRSRRRRRRRKKSSPAP